MNYSYFSKVTRNDNRLVVKVTVSENSIKGVSNPHFGIHSSKGSTLRMQLVEKILLITFSVIPLTRKKNEMTVVTGNSREVPVRRALIWTKPKPVRHSSINQKAHNDKGSEKDSDFGSVTPGSLTFVDSHKVTRGEEHPVVCSPIGTTTLSTVVI